MDSGKYRNAEIAPTHHPHAADWQDIPRAPPVARGFSIDGFDERRIILAMSTLSSASTTAEVRAAYDNNASWFEDQSAAKARAFVTACNILLARLPKRVSRSASSAANEIELDLVQIEKQRTAASKWLVSSGGGSGGNRVRHLSFRNFRG